MKHKMFTVFDVKAQCYLSPFCLPERGMAIRAFSDCVNNKEHQFGKHPGDYTLFELGFFDDAVALVSCHAGEKIVNGLEVVISGEYEPELKFREDIGAVNLVEDGDEAS